MLTAEATLEALAEADGARSLDRSNLLLAHPLVPSVERHYADINEIEVDDRLLKADLVLLGHYHVHTRVRDGVWYAGSTDTFSFADDPDEPKGVVVLDTDTGHCRHLAVPGRRPLVTLETVHALGLGPGEVEDLVLTRAATVADGAVARLYLDGIDPEAYRLLDLSAIREAAGEGLHFQVIPTFADVAASVQLPELDSMGERWAGYVDKQDLGGYDRRRIIDTGERYLARAVEEATD